MKARAATLRLAAHRWSRLRLAVILAVALCLAVPRSEALDACSVLSIEEVSSALNAGVEVSEAHLAEDTVHLSACGYTSSAGGFLIVVLSDDPKAYDNAQRSRPQGKIVETPIEGLGSRAVVWNLEDGVQAMAAVDQRFVRVALMKQPRTDPATAQKVVVSFVREALNADWETSAVPNGASVHYLLKKDTGVLVSQTAPVYPPLARRARVQGQVVLKALIGKDGSVEKLQAISGHPMLVPAAIAAVKQWKYKPYLVDSQPVQVETEVHVNFSLSSDSGDTSPPSPPVNPPTLGTQG